MRMMLTFLTIVMMSPMAHAEKFKSRVYEVDSSKKKDVPHIVKFENGRVGFLKSTELETMMALRESAEANDVLEIELDQDFDLKGVLVVERGGQD